MNDDLFDSPPADGLDRFLREARPDVPAGFADRLLAKVNDPAERERRYWAEVAGAARRALILSAAVLLFAAFLAGLTLAPHEAPAVSPQPAPTVIAREDNTPSDESVEQMAGLAVSAQEVETELASTYWLLDEEN